MVDEVSKILGKKRPTNGVKVEVGEKECSIEIFIIVEYGYPISEVAHEVQKAVLKAVSELSGLKVVEVNVYGGRYSGLQQSCIKYHRSYLWDVRS